MEDGNLAASHGSVVTDPRKTSSENAPAWLRIVGMWLCWIITIPGLVAQIRSGSITGAVLDQSGAVVPDAKVTVVETATNQRYGTKSNDAGEFQVPYLPPGNYRTEVSREGFQNSVRGGIVVGATQAIRIEVRLAVARAAESIQVTAATTALQVDSATVQTATSDRLIDALPNLAHNPLAYVSLQAGVTSRAAQSSATGQNSFAIGLHGRRQISSFGINGGMGGENEVQLDGLSVLGAGWNEVSVVPNQDSIQEVRASVNSLSAEYGRGQGVISMVTRGGTNDFHGTGFYRHRNSVLNANTFENNARNIARQDLKIHTYGGSVGGPIVRNKAFFFASYEGLYNNNPVTYLRTVPTALEKRGDFSRTVVNVGGVPTPLQLFDPFSAVQISPNVFRRMPVPNSIIPRPNPGALNIYSNYPDPNRTPDDVYNLNNFLRIPLQQIRRNNFNSRVDYRLRDSNSLYFTGGYTRGNINNPLTWADDNYWNSIPGESFARFIGDRNPYFAIGDTWVISPTTVLDIRIGVNRINAQATSDEFDSLDYRRLGIPAEVEAAIPVPAIPTTRPAANTNWSALNNNGGMHKRERQTNHVLAGSLSKTSGKWNFKFGGELRNMLANFRDPFLSVGIITDPTFTVQTVNATGGVSGATNPATAGHPGASLLLGAGSLNVSRATSVLLSLAHQYGALYTQNDWRPTSRLTLNLGLRWDWQPGMTERYNRVSSFDGSATNPYGGQGVIYFPGAHGNGRRLYDTYWPSFQPRLGVAWRLNDSTVIRAGAGLIYLPANTGYFGGPFQYGSQSFAPYTDSLPYGLNPSGVPVGTYGQVNTVIPVTGADLRAPTIYGSQGPHFPTHDFKTPRVYHVNFHIDRGLGKGWTASIGYNGAFARRTHLGYTAINSDQFLPDSLLASWRADHIARNATGNAGTDQVRNPFQPASGPLIPFLGNLGAATMPRNQTLWPYAYYFGMTVHNNNGFSDYNSLQFGVRKEYSNGLMVGAHYIWSRSLGVTNGVVQNNLGPEGIPVVVPNLRDLNQNKHLSQNDVPHRVVVTYLYELPFGRGKALGAGSRVASALVSGWQVAGTYIYQTGVPLYPNGAANGTLNGRPNIAPGAPMELPKELQRWYDGRTRITLPSGRQVTPCNLCFMKYNPDFFAGGLTTGANGNTIQDNYWWGNANVAYSAIRSSPFNNVTLSVRRSFKITEGMSLEFQADATNLFNHTQFSPTGWDMNLGNTEIRNNAAAGQSPGAGQNANYGTHGTATFDPRLLELQVKFRF